MIPTTKIDSVDVHTTIISPVIGQRQDQLHVSGFRSLNDYVKFAKVNFDSSVRLEPLHDSILSACVVLRQTAGRKGSVVVMKRPCTDDL